MLSFSKASPGVIVALAFGMCLLLLVAATIVLRDMPSAEENCKQLCATRNKAGVLVPQFSPERTAGMRGKGPMQCECK